MRIYTLTLSIVVHLAAVFALVVVPLVATDVLPDPRRAFEFVMVTPLVVPSPPPPARPRTEASPAPASSDAAPLSAPEGMQPEVVRPPTDIVEVDRSVVPGVPLTGALLGGEALPPPPPPRVTEPVRPGGLIRYPAKVRDQAPIYPSVARAARIEGTVILEAVIDSDGTVREVRVLRSVPLLDSSAMDAVREWRFTPTLLNGEPVPIVLTVTVTFRLS